MNQTTHSSLTIAVLLTVGAVTVQPTAAQLEHRPGSPALAVSAQDTEDRRREAAAAARARRRYQAAIDRREQPAADRRRADAARARDDATAPRHPQPQRVEQPRTPPSILSRPPYRPQRQPSQLGALFRSAGQVARTIERAKHGRLNLPRELNRAGRMIDRHQRR